MSKTILIICLSTCLIRLSFGQLNRAQIDPLKVPKIDYHYQAEYLYDITIDSVQWTKQNRGLNVGFGTTDELYLRCEVPQLHHEVTTWEGTGWKGEQLNAQILVWSPDTLQQVRFTLNDLVNSRGQVISKRNMKLDLIRYVLSNYPYAAKNSRCDIALNDTAYLIPDRFEKFERFDLPANTVRPLWLGLKIPEETEPGVYSGSIEIYSENQSAFLNIKVRVQHLVLPEPKDWKFRLDLWQNPWVVAWYYHVRPWSDEHKSMLKKHLKLYADAGGKYITTYTVHSPWSNNSYMIEETMIDWTKRKDGSWEFDYSIFDQYVELAIETGIDEAITIYTPIPWGHRFRYLDEVSGNFIYEEWPPGSNQFKEFWNTFLDDLKVHLKEKNWLEKTYLGINENSLQNTIEAITVIKENSSGWKITYAGNWHPELSSLLDDYSLIINSQPGLNEVKERSSRGSTTTFYVCCTPPQPNNFVFSPPVESRYISWYAVAYGYDGFLRWAYDAWPADPMRDARHISWPAGDCFLVYPGGNSSIRFEKLKEGIIDFEKIRILRELASKSSDVNVINLMNEFEEHLSLIKVDSVYNQINFKVPLMLEVVKKRGGYY